MKAWRLYGINDLRYEEGQRPSPEAGQVLLNVKAAGICGSDIQRVFETGAHRHPLVIGHEFSGVVEEVGPEVDEAWLQKRVGVFPLIPCGKCGPCRQKKYEMCRSYNYLGSRCDGGFAEYAAVPVANLIELPENVSFEEAAMLEPMAVAVHAMRQGIGGENSRGPAQCPGAGYSSQAVLSRDAPVTICGFGTIGTLLGAFLTEAGYRNLYVVGNKDSQRERALSMGISPHHYCDGKKEEVSAWLQEHAGGTDAFFECTGKNQVLTWGIDSVRPSGKVILVGNPLSDMTLGRDTYWKILRNQLTLTGTWNSSFTGEDTDDWHYAVKRLETCSIAPAALITHRLPRRKLWDGLMIMREKKEDYCKIVISSGA